MALYKLVYLKNGTANFNRTEIEDYNSILVRKLGIKREDIFKYGNLCFISCMENLDTLSEALQIIIYSGDVQAVISKFLR